MKLKLFSVFIIFCIVLVGTIGIFAFGDIVAGDANCPFESFSGEVCSVMTTAFSTVIHHISGFQSLLQSILNSNTNIFSLILMALIFTRIVYQKYSQLVFLVYENLLFKTFRIDKKIQQKLFVYLLRKWLVLIKDKDSNSDVLVYEKILL